MRITEFKKQFMKRSLRDREAIISNMKNDIEPSKKRLTEIEHLNFLNLIKWAQENLNKEL